MKIRLGDLRRLIREHFRHGVTTHEKNPDTKRVMKAMQDSPTLQKSFGSIDTPRELAGIIEELIDATGMSRDEISQALSILYRHEKPRKKI